MDWKKTENFILKRNKKNRMNLQLKNTIFWMKMGGGRNVEFQNVDRPKISERRNGLFSWSERQNQNVENVFWVDQN